MAGLGPLPRIPTFNPGAGIETEAPILVLEPERVVRENVPRLLVFGFVIKMSSTNILRSIVFAFAGLACVAAPAFGQKRTAAKQAVKRSAIMTAPSTPIRARQRAVSRGIEVNKQRIAMDYEPDGRADYVVFNPASNTWQVLQSSGGTFVQPFGQAHTDYMAPGDYDGDGKGDLAVFRDTEHKWYVRLSSDGSTVVTDFGATGDEPVARDYDGDGKTDLAYIRRASGTMNWTYRPSGGGPDVTVNWGVATDTAAPGFYDADAKCDIAVRRAGTPAATGTAVFIIKKSTDGTQQNIDWGLGSDLVIPGDYDGDGLTDAAVLREGKRQTDPLTWLIRRSSDGTALVFNLGTTGSDYNVQNDYDGDTATDIAVWNNATATFTYRSSITTALISQAWGATNDYPVASFDTH